MKILEILKPKNIKENIPIAFLRRRFCLKEEIEEKALPIAYEFEIGVPMNYDFEKDKTPEYACQILMLDSLIKQDLIDQREYENAKKYIKTKFKVA